MDRQVRQDGGNAALETQQLLGHLPVERVLEQFADLVLHVLISAGLQKRLGGPIGQGGDIHRAVFAKPDVLRIGEQQPLVLQVFGEGENLRFTQSRDGKGIYILALEWPGGELVVGSLGAGALRLGEGAEITLLGHEGLLGWTQDNDGLKIGVPAAGREKVQHAWVFRVRTSAG